jgi:hypothetical protein
MVTNTTPRFLNRPIHTIFRRRYRHRSSSSNSRSSHNLNTSISSKALSSFSTRRSSTTHDAMYTKKSACLKFKLIHAMALGGYIYFYFALVLGKERFAGKD